jgi:hypothetical protein
MGLLIKGLITLGRVGEISRLYVGNVVLKGLSHDFLQISIAPQKTGLKFLRDSQHVMHYQYLTIYIASGTDADYGNGERFCYALS